MADIEPRYPESTAREQVARMLSETVVEVTLQGSDAPRNALIPDERAESLSIEIESIYRSQISKVVTPAHLALAKARMLASVAQKSSNPEVKEFAGKVLAVCLNPDFVFELMVESLNLPDDFVLPAGRILEVMDG